MRKIKILHFELDTNVGGIESFLLNLYSGIDRRHFQFDFITRSNNPAMSNEFELLGGKIYKVSSYSNPYQYFKDVMQILKKGYDIVHIHKNSAANILPIIVTKQFRDIKIIVHSHNTRPSIDGLAGLLHKLNRRYLWNNSDMHLACSNAAGVWMYGKNKTFRVMSNGIQSEKYLFNECERHIVRHENGISQDAFVVGHVGRFVKQKNHYKLIDIFSEIRKVNNNSILMLIGDGELKEAVREQVRDLGLENSVFFMGARKDVARLMKGMDVFVMPSLYEGLPIVAVEAQATGLSLYLSDKISKETQITDNVCWFMLESESENIASMITNEKKQGEISDKRRKDNEIVASAGYDIAKTTREISEMYRSLCEQ